MPYDSVQKVCAWTEPLYRLAQYAQGRDLAASWLAWRHLRDDLAARPGINAVKFAHTRSEA